MARVSIGLPVYNGEQYLVQALDSLLAQSFEDFELIISDNASADTTPDICGEYAGLDKRIRYYRSPKNLGLARNFNRVFGLAESEYFRWATADDVSAPEQLEKCLEVLDREPAVVLCYPKTTLIDEQGDIIRRYDDNLDLRFSSPKERLYHFLKHVGLCNAQYGLIRSRVLSRTRLFRSFPGSDVSLLGELTLHGQFFEIPEYLFFRRLHRQASSSITSEKERQKFWDTTSRGETSLLLWREQYENFAATVRAPLNFHEKAQVAYMLFRVGFSDRKDLIKELARALRLWNG